MGCVEEQIRVHLEAPVRSCAGFLNLSIDTGLHCALCGTALCSVGCYLSMECQKLHLPPNVTSKNVFGH